MRPYRVQLVHDDEGRVVGANIRVEDGGELDYDTVRVATNELTNHFRRRQFQARNDRRSPAPEVLRKLRQTYGAGAGKVTDDYLAMVAASYAELRDNAVTDIAGTIAGALGGPDGPPAPLPTVRTHIKRARGEGWLTPAQQGKADGELTEKAREHLRSMNQA